MTTKPKLGRFGAFRTPDAAPAGETLVRRSHLDQLPALPLVIEPALPDVDVVRWAAAHRDELTADLQTAGAILFRGFAIAPERVEAFVEAVSGPALDYTERSSPRHRVGGHVYTSTDYPADQTIFFHNENAYAHTFPLKLFFYCVTPAAEGGETPLADVRKVYARLDPDLRARFEREGVRYVRNYRGDLGLDWRTVFQSDDRHEVEARAKASGYDVEWRESGRLRTRRVGPAVRRHPQTGETVWFNHAAFFHLSTLAPAVQAGLRTLGEAELPHQTYYGEGEPIPDDVAAALRAAYDAESVRFPWQTSDLLMIDNMLVAHARSPFRGAREVRVAMSEPFSGEIA